MNDDATFKFILHWLGVICAVLAFFGSWIYCVSEYGYLLGFGLGWVPSAILASFIYALIRYLWWLLVILCIGIAYFLKNG